MINADNELPGSGRRSSSPEVTRLAIFATHPIQYQAPWFRALAAVPRLEIEVMFSHVPDAREQGEGFGTAFVWDIPLLTGYSYRVFETRLLPKPAPGFARRWSSGLALALDRFKPHAAIVLGWHEISLVQALFACRRRQIPIILRGESNALRRRPYLVEALHRRYFSLCDAFLAIGTANAQLYRRAGIEDSRILLAGYFVDNVRFRTAADRLRGERMAIRGGWSIPPDSVCFAFVGKLERKKCVLHFLEAIARARARGSNVHGLVVGTGEQMAEARALCEARRIPVFFTGFLNQSEIAHAYVAADAVVLPSDYGETWGLVVNEAMATGLPAIVSNRVGSANDLVINDETGQVYSHGDIDLLARKIDEMARDEARRRQMGQAAQRLVTSEFTIERAVEQTCAALALLRSSYFAAA